MKRTLLAAILISFLFMSSASAYWVWTPETKRWVNPKYAAKPNPRDQFNFAKGYFDHQDYIRAMREFDRLIQYFPKAQQAADSQYYIGLCLEKMRKPYEAYQAYQKVINKYPYSERVEEILKRQYDIACRFMEGQRRMILGMNLPAQDLAIEIFRKIIDNSPNGSYADISQYKIGLVLKALGRPDEAKEEFEKVIENYTNSQWAEAAKYQIALCAAKIAPGPEYSQEVSREAQERFQEFVKSHPDAELSKEAETKLSELKVKEAESNFKIGKFYERINKLESAKIYYKYIVDNFPDGNWAALARTRLEAIEKGRK